MVCHVTIATMTFVTRTEKTSRNRQPHLSRFPLIGMYAFPVRRCRHILYGAASAQPPISC